MSSQFDFLEEYNQDAFLLVQDMEKTLYDQPLSAFVLGGRFLENMRNLLYKKFRKKLGAHKKRYDASYDGETDIDVDSLKEDSFSEDIARLSHLKLIDKKYADKIIGAYKIRNRLHLHKFKDDYDKKSVLELYKEIFEISVWYCKDMDPTFKDIEFKEPTRQETIKKKIPNVKVVKLFDKCIICGCENNSTNRNICPKCKRRIRAAHELDDLRSILDTDLTFNKEFLKENSYDDDEIKSIMRYLKEFELISDMTNNLEYIINKKELNDFIKKGKSYGIMEKLLIAFYEGNIAVESVIDKSFYKLGKSGTYPYIEYYKLVVDQKIENYLNLKGKHSADAMVESCLTYDEISYWYTLKIKEKSKHTANDLFNGISEILMNKWTFLREKREKKEDIFDKLKLNDVILDFWFDRSVDQIKQFYFKDFIDKNDKIEMKFFIEALNNGLGKKEAIIYADTTEDFIDKTFNLPNEKALLSQWELLNQHKTKEYYNAYKNIYFYKKSNEFRTKLKGNTIGSALKMSNLDSDDFNRWYDFGKREFEKIDADLESELYGFYIKTTKVLMDNWLTERKKGTKRYKSCDKFDIGYKTLKEWFIFKDSKPNDFDTNKKYEFFRNLYMEDDKINMDNIIKSIENGNNKKNAILDAEISLEDFERYYRSGKELKDGSYQDNELSEKYLEFYNKYEEIYLPKRREHFLKEFEKVDDLEKAAKSSELTMEDINYAYDAGKNGEEELIEFYEKLLDLKIKVYTYLIVYKYPKDTLLKTGLTQEEIEENKDSINEFMLVHKMILVANGDKRLDKMEKKYNIPEDEVYGWLTKGKELMEKSDVDYLDAKCINKKGILNYFAEFNDEVDNNFDFYCMKFYNLYNEARVKRKLKKVKNNSEKKDIKKSKLKSMLNKEKINKNEFKVWDKLGLLEQELIEHN